MVRRVHGWWVTARVGSGLDEQEEEEEEKFRRKRRSQVATRYGAESVKRKESALEDA